ncbi:MAG: 6,7-dimethyl-8-ribityllumazine synthase [Sphingobacteriales bacterium]|nr:MAG: 6,7-dimethyl-8-ribityllumazine synthase [Sphingobacteriales bacterium]
MSTTLKTENSEITLHEKVKKAKIGIAVAQWNKEITFTLRDGAKAFLEKHDISGENIHIHLVSGAYELPLAAQFLLELGNMDAVIAIGCLIKGETPHFHYISESVSLSLNNVALKYNKPVGFGVLTVDALEQAQERAGGKLGNKGEEAAEAVLQMLSLKETVQDNSRKGKQIGFAGR